MLAADNWCVKVDDRVYGPYTSQQLRKFANEGRLASWSLIAPAGSRSWREAKNEAAFATFFGTDIRPAAPRSFGRRDDSAVTAGAETFAASSAPAVAPRRVVIEKSQDSGQSATAQASVGPANFIVVFDVVNAAASRVEAAILSLGPAFRIAENVWTVSCELTAIGVRNAVAPYLLPRESIFVVDTTRGRTSWQNYAPETHAKLAAAWTGAR